MEITDQEEVLNSGEWNVLENVCHEPNSPQDNNSEDDDE
jgi:hypothetical protein